MSRPFADADAFRAIADPTRRRILDLLRRRPLTPREIMANVKRAGSTLSAHLRILRVSGLITQRRHGRRRVYVVCAGRLKPIERWLSAHVIDDRAAR